MWHVASCFVCLFLAFSISVSWVTQRKLTEISDCYLHFFYCSREKCLVHTLSIPAQYCKWCWKEFQLATVSLGILILLNKKALL